MSHFTLILAMYYYCHVKVKGGSVYYGNHIKYHDKRNYFQRSFMIACSNPGAGQYIMV